MKKRIIKILLAALNSQWLNPTPCKYEFVGNVDAFSREDLESSARQDESLTVREYLNAADRFKACPASKVGISVIEEDGSYSLNRGF